MLLLYTYSYVLLTITTNRILLEVKNN